LSASDLRAKPRFHRRRGIPLACSRFEHFDFAISKLTVTLVMGIS
jgi:hypothetical protein